MNKRFHYIMLLILAVSFTLALGGCNKSDDGDNDSGDDDNDDFTATLITFTPAGSPQAGDIWLELEPDLKENSFILSVHGNAIEETYGVAGRLLFDREMASLDAATAGDALAGSEVQIKALGGSNDKGGVFGFSRSGDYTHSVTLDAGKIIGTLQFTVTAAGETDIVFDEDRSLILNHDFELAEVNNWLGGTLVVE